MKIDLSNPPYAVKLKELGFAYSYTDCEKGVIVYTHASPRLVGSPWIDCWDDMECIIDFEDESNRTRGHGTTGRRRTTRGRRFIARTMTQIG